VKVFNLFKTILLFLVEGFCRTSLRLMCTDRKVNTKYFRVCGNGECYAQGTNNGDNCDTSCPNPKLLLFIFFNVCSVYVICLEKMYIHLHLCYNIYICRVGYICMGKRDGVYLNINTYFFFFTKCL
jgi:hypothetical protein